MSREHGPPQSLARPCADRDCRDRHEPAERIALAETLCRARGVRLTRLRRHILEQLWRSARPLGAYELLAGLRRTPRPAGPPTVYRALDFLVAQGLVARIESRNAYVPCAHPERRHHCLFFLCVACAAATEVEDRRIDRLLSEDAASLDYAMLRRVIEVEGTCRHCRAG